MLVLVYALFHLILVTILCHWYYYLYFTDKTENSHYMSEIVFIPSTVTSKPVCFYHYAEDLYNTKGPLYSSAHF